LVTKTRLRFASSEDGVSTPTGAPRSALQPETRCAKEQKTMIGIPLALLAANATEWVVHKYVLHGLGKKKSSFWAFHWHEHHAESRKGEEREDVRQLDVAEILAEAVVLRAAKPMADAAE
jgi:hypothetical protein